VPRIAGEAINNSHSSGNQSNKMKEDLLKDNDLKNL